MTRLALVCALIACLFVPVIPAAAAEDFTGKWSGAFLAGRPDGTSSEDKIFLDLKHKGAELTGTAGPSETKQWPLTQGKVDGDKLTFQLEADGIAITFSLVFAAGHLKGDASAALPDGSKLTGKVDAERTK